MKSISLYVVALLVFTAAATAQTTIVGSKDYGLASSSVMWMPRGSTVFLNPAELGRVHQDEFLFNTSRFNTMSSMTGAFSFPFSGTLAMGIANENSLTHYTLGYGTLLGSYNTFGTAVTILSPIEDGFRFSFGSALHFPFSEQNSGFHAGISISNLPQAASINGGIAWWIVSDWLRLQAAAQNRTYRAMLYGAEFLASNNFSFLAGTQAFNSMYGGISLKTSSLSASLTGGPAGMTLTLNIVVGETAEDQNSISYEEGYNLFSEKRYNEAYQKFLLALQYDEYDDDSRGMAERSLAVKDSVEEANQRLAKMFEEKSDYPNALKAYSMLILANPSNAAAESLLADTHKKFSEYVKQLITSGDSLKDRRDIAGARKNYDLALKYDSGNDVASARIDELDNLSKENVKSILVRAQSMLTKKQFEDAQKEYERVLSIEPKNSRAKAGLNAIETKKKEAQFETAKVVFDEGKYFEALTMMLELSKQNIKNKELDSYIQTAREKLQPEVEKRFKAGLSYYVNENYDHAITVWDSALIIQPRHAGILEYRKRAEEKMKALELLK